MASLLDLDSLFSIQPVDTEKLAKNLGVTGKEADSDCRAGGGAGHSGHNGEALFSDMVCPPKALQHKAFCAIDTGDTADTVDFQGGEGQRSGGAPGGGAASYQFALHPAAVVLLLAYCRKVRAGNDERISALLHLETMPPGEQVKRWHSACVEIGIKPWEVLMLPAPASGLDCTMCKHLTTRSLSPSASERRQFHWACAHGFLILETGRGTERIWIAPPECSSWERWRPGSGR